MKRVFVLFVIIVFLVTNAYAGEREWRMNLFDNNGWVRPFHIGGMFCDQKKHIWSEKCQDAMLEDIYGNIWPEIKEIILAFQKAVIEKDYRYLKGKTIIPKEKLSVMIFVRYDTIARDLITEEYDLVRVEQIEKAFLNKIPDKLREKIKNLKYEDMKFDRWWEAMMFDFKCGLRFKVICDYTKNPPACHYTLKIEGLRLDLQSYNLGTTLN